MSAERRRTHDQRFFELFGLLRGNRGVLLERCRHSFDPREHVRVQPEVSRWQFRVVEKKEQFILRLNETLL